MDTLTEFRITSMRPDSNKTGTSPGIWFMVFGLLLLTWDDSRNINIEPGVDQSRSQVIVIHRLHKIFYCHTILENKSQFITQSVASYSFLSRWGPRSLGLRSHGDHYSHPSLNGRVAKILTRELVYYILLGTLRGSQKYH